MEYVMARPAQKQSIYKIAQEAGVSASAVSCVLNNRPGVSDETRKRIINTIDLHGYTRNYQRTDGRTIGVVLPGVWKEWYISAIMAGVMAYNAETNVNIATIVCHPSNSKSLPELLRSHHCDAAIIVMPSLFFDEIRGVVEYNIPIVLIDARMADIGFSDELKHIFGYVDNNSYQGSYDLTKYLISQGHRKIAFVIRNPSSNDQNNKSRINGWFDAMLELGTSPCELQKNLYYVENSISGIQALPLKKKVFTALMANDDGMAMICLCACHAMGIKIPDDLSVTGFGNMEGSEFLAPPLTTVDQKAYSVGYEASRHTGELLLGKRKDLPRLVLPTELIIRKSTRPVAL